MRQENPVWRVRVPRLFQRSARGRQELHPADRLGRNSHHLIRPPDHPPTQKTHPCSPLSSLSPPAPFPLSPSSAPQPSRPPPLACHPSEPSAKRIGARELPSRPLQLFAIIGPLGLSLSMQQAKNQFPNGSTHKGIHPPSAGMLPLKPPRMRK